jgi:hypothetical protein
VVKKVTSILTSQNVEIICRSNFLNRNEVGIVSGVIDLWHEDSGEGKKIVNNKRKREIMEGELCKTGTYIMNRGNIVSALGMINSSLIKS